MAKLETAALAAWYGSRPVIRRLCALRDTQGLRVFAYVERAFGSDEIHPAWSANREVWIEERNPFGDEVVNGSAGVIVAALLGAIPSLS